MITCTRSTVVTTLSLLALGMSALASATTPEILVLSNRADLITGGDALVEIRVPGYLNPAQGVKLDVDGRSVTNAFAKRADGRFYGLVTGLRDGTNVLRAVVPGGSASITLTNHPIGGPVFSGPQVLPWTCSTTSNPSLGPALDAQCNAPTAYRYMYRTTSNTFAVYDPNAATPANLAMTTTDQGVTVPYIVRIERGTMNRGIHEIAVLFNPAASWTPWARQPQWNQKLSMLYGAGTSQILLAGYSGLCAKR